MRIALYGRPENGKAVTYVQTVLDFLQAEGQECAVHVDLLSSLERCEHSAKFSSHEDLGEADVMISLGGDGTLLNTLTLIRDKEIPVLGINTGRLGFLANVSTDRLEQALKALLRNELKMEQRMLIKASSDDIDFGGFSCALNEATVHKKDTSSMVSIKVHVDGSFMNNYWADGLIVCTPTGSTAYSLSCGGPIVMPGSRNFSITPIAPHNLNVRPMVLSSDSVIEIQAEGREEQFLFTLDSRSYPLKDGGKVKLEKAAYSMHLLNFEDQDFFSTIRNKMLWGLDKRN